MATEDQEETARYYQGLANDAQLNAEAIAKVEATGLAEQRRLEQTLSSLQRQRQTAITNAQREQIDNSIRVQTNNLDKNKSAVAQLQTERTAALQRVTANENLAKEAVGGPAAAKNIPGPASTPAPPPPPPSTIPVTPAATPAAAPPPPPPAPPPKATPPSPPFGSTQADGNAGESAARVEPRRSPPEDFVFDEDGALLPSDSARAAERRAEIAAEENRARAFDAVDRSGSTQADGNAGEREARIAPKPPSPPEDFVFDEDGSLIPSDSSRAAERREEIAAEENRARAFDAVDRSGSTNEGDAGDAEAQLAIESRNARGVPVNTTQVWDPETGTYGVWDEDSGTLIATGLTEQEAAEAAGDPFESERLRQEAEFEQNQPAVFEADPPNDFVYDEVTGEMVPSDSDRAAEIRAEESAPEPVPPNLSAIWDPETESWGVYDNDNGVFLETGYATEADAQRAAGDPFEAARLERESEEDLPEAFGPEPVPDNYTAIFDPEGTPPNNWAVWNDTQGVYESQGLTEQEAKLRAENLSLGVDEPFPQGTPGGTGLTPEEQAAKDEAAAKANAINQATRQSVYKQAGSSDWRVRLQLAPTSNYLYNANPPGILAPLATTNGVIFPYTPQIQTTYRANYTNYDLVHSNFRGVFYQSSRVDDINIRAEFTAQDTQEADYLLATIHFFRSVTKMFYGQDSQRGTPPPLVYLSGLGMNQFYGHPCLVSAFNYTLPNNVDYIRATNVNNYGTDLLSRRTPSKSSSVAGLGATGNRILNAGLEKFFPSKKPAPDPVVGTVNNTQLANYVPTKMEIDIVLIPVQTRTQVSKQFSLDAFANGDLIKKGFW